MWLAIGDYHTCVIENSDIGQLALHIAAYYSAYMGPAWHLQF